jgi:histidinol phosphatase-like enzyme (inositol monophosphatase family)
MAEPIDLKTIDAVVRPLINEAGEIARRRFRTPLPAEDKGGSQGYDPVTEADRATEKYLRSALAALFPGHQIMGEEEGVTGLPGRVCWVIDPIDGTKSFISGVPAWGVVVGLVADGIPVAGWVLQPFLGETFVAVNGTGWLETNDHCIPLRTSSILNLSSATMYSTHPGMFTTAAEREAFEALAGRVRLQRFGGDCYSYCLLALGHIDLVVEASLQPYDIVPLIPIVEAAGGLITGPGREPPVGGFVIAAANTTLHAEALDVIGSCAQMPEEA